jgi:hypothetical protein
MSRTLIFSTGFVALAAFAGAASAQDVVSSCNPATGLSANGTPCVELTPVDPATITTTVSGDAIGADQYRPLDKSTLGQTYQCRTVDARNPQYGPGGALLIEDCGAPLSSAELGNLQPFYGSAGAPPPPPPAPAPVVVAAPPPAPVVVPPAGPVFAPVPTVPAAGLGAAGLLAAGVGAAALAGIIIAVADDDDDDGSSSTTTTN